MGLDIHTYNGLIGPLTPKEFEIKNIIKTQNYIKRHNLICSSTESIYYIYGNMHTACLNVTDASC